MRDSISASAKVMDFILMTTENNTAFLNLRLDDGNLIEFQMGQHYNHIDLTKIPDDTAKLIREYRDGSITINHVREALGLAPTQEERDLMDRIDCRIEEFLREALSGLLPEEPDEETVLTWDGEEDAGTAAESDDEFEVKEIYISLPAGVPMDQIKMMIDQAAKSGKTYTLRVEGWKS